MISLTKEEMFLIDGGSIIGRLFSQIKFIGYCVWEFFDYRRRIK